MKIQQWSPRRVGLLLLVLLLGLLMTQPLFGMYQEETRPDTHLGVRSLGCGGDLEPLWLVAQAVPSASAVPCVSTLPDGWRLHYASANRGRAELAGARGDGVVGALDQLELEVIGRLDLHIRTLSGHRSRLAAPGFR